MDRPRRRGRGALSMIDAGLGYRVWWQEFAGWRTRAMESWPEKQFRDYPTIEEAEAEKRRLKKEHGPGLLACVTPVPAPRKGMAKTGAAARSPAPRRKLL